MKDLAQQIVDPAFWQQPLETRSAELDRLRESARFPHAEIVNRLTRQPEPFRAVLRYGDVMEISRRPEDFQSGQGAINIFDLPAEAAEAFGSFINMDDPRHARMRRIVSRSFSPQRLSSVTDLVTAVTHEAIDGFCEKGRADLVEVLSTPVPLLIICDMLGVEREHLDTILRTTNIILGAGDPEYVEGDSVSAAIFEAGATLTELMQELAEQRRADPRDDLITKLVYSADDEEVLSPEEFGPFFILLATAGNDTTRNAISHGIDLLSKNPDQRRIWQDDIEAVTPTAVEEIVRLASPVTFMRRTATADVTVGDEPIARGERLVMFYGPANRDPRAFDRPETFDVLRDPNNHLGYGGPGPHFCLGAHLARREVGVALAALLERLPDLEVASPAVPLHGATAPPLVGGIKHLPVEFTPTAPIGNGRPTSLAERS